MLAETTSDVCYSRTYFHSTKAFSVLDMFLYALQIDLLAYLDFFRHRIKVSNNSYVQIYMQCVTYFVTSNIVRELRSCDTS